jgi:hypothetical protein
MRNLFVALIASVAEAGPAAVISDLSPFQS